MIKFLKEKKNKYLNNEDIDLTINQDFLPQNFLPQNFLPQNFLPQNFLPNKNIEEFLNNFNEICPICKKSIRNLNWELEEINDLIFLNKQNSIFDDIFGVCIHCNSKQMKYIYNNIKDTKLWNEVL